MDSFRVPSGRPFRSSSGNRLPHGVKDRLASALTPFRNREAAYRLALFLGRFWSTPNHITMAFPIDRRAIADRADLGLTEAQVRGATRALEVVGFLDRAIPAKGSSHQRTAAGELHRKPVLFQFGSGYAEGFIKAIKRAREARDRRSQQGDPKLELALEQWRRVFEENRRT